MASEGLADASAALLGLAPALGLAFASGADGLASVGAGCAFAFPLLGLSVPAGGFAAESSPNTLAVASAMGFVSGAFFAAVSTACIACQVMSKVDGLMCAGHLKALQMLLSGWYAPIVPDIVERTSTIRRALTVSLRKNALQARKHCSYLPWPVKYPVASSMHLLLISTQERVQ